MISGSQLRWLFGQMGRHPLWLLVASGGVGRCASDPGPPYNAGSQLTIGSLPRFFRAVSFFTLACFLFHRLGPFRPRRAASARLLRSRRAPGPRPGVKIIVILGEFVGKVAKLCNSIGFSNKSMKRLLFFFGAARLFCLESITFFN